MNALDRRVLAVSAAFGLAGIVGFVGAAATGSGDAAVPGTTAVVDAAPQPTSVPAAVEPAPTATAPPDPTTTLAPATTTSTSTSTSTTSTSTTTTEPTDDSNGDGPDRDDSDEFDSNEFLADLDRCLPETELLSGLRYATSVDDETLEWLADSPFELCDAGSGGDEVVLGVVRLDTDRLLDDALCLLLGLLADDADVEFVSPSPCDDRMSSSDDGFGSSDDGFRSSDGETDSSDEETDSSDDGLRSSDEETTAIDPFAGGSQ